MTQWTRVSKEPQNCTWHFQVLTGTSLRTNWFFLYKPVPTARSTSYLENTGEDYLPDRLSRPLLQALITCVQCYSMNYALNRDSGYAGWNINLVFFSASSEAVGAQKVNRKLHTPLVFTFYATRISYKTLNYASLFSLGYFVNTCSNSWPLPESLHLLLISLSFFCVKENVIKYFLVFVYFLSSLEISVVSLVYFITKIQLPDPDSELEPTHNNLSIRLATYATA